MGVCVWSLFCNSVLCVLLVLQLPLLGKESWLLYFNCLVAVSVLSLFLTVPCVGLQCVNVLFPIHTYLLF